VLDRVSGEVLDRLRPGHAWGGVGRVRQPQDPLREHLLELRDDLPVHPDAVVRVGEVPHGVVVVPGRREVTDDRLGALDRGHRGVCRAVDHEGRLGDLALVRGDVEVRVGESAAGDVCADGARDQAQERARHAGVAQVGIGGERRLLARGDHGRGDRDEEGDVVARRRGDRRDPAALALAVHAHPLGIDVRAAPQHLDRSEVVASHGRIVALARGVRVEPLVRDHGDDAGARQVARRLLEGGVVAGAGAVDEHDAGVTCPRLGVHRVADLGLDRGAVEFHLDDLAGHLVGPHRGGGHVATDGDVRGLHHDGAVERAGRPTGSRDRPHEPQSEDQAEGGHDLPVDHAFQGTAGAVWGPNPRRVRSAALGRNGG